MASPINEEAQVTKLEKTLPKTSFERSQSINSGLYFGRWVMVLAEVD